MDSLILQSIKTMLSRITGLDPGEINDQDSLVDDLGVDSLKVIEIATEIERSYKVKIKDSQLMNIKSVADAANILEELLTKNNAAR